MKIIKTKIKNLFIIKPKTYFDNRGFFLKVMLKKYSQYSKRLFCQDNLSLSKKNVLRGIHFQWKKPQAQIIHLILGKIFIAFVRL